VRLDMGDTNTMLCFEFYACPVVAVIITLHGSIWSLHIVSPTYTLILKKLMTAMPVPVASPAVIVGSNPERAWVSVSCEYCVLSGCDEQITRPEKSYRLWCVVVCDIETS
jgi:hypothetical protein